MKNRYIFTVSVTAIWAFSSIGTLHSAEIENDAQRQPIRVEPDAEGSPDFNRDILPIFRRNCLACHNSTTAEADVVLESPDNLRAERDEGMLVSAGDLEASRLWQVVARHEEPIMPPEDNDVGAKPLSPDELGLIKSWIEQGARSSAGDPQLAVIAWRPLPSAFGSIYATAVSEFGNYAICAQGNQLQVYDLVRGQLLSNLVDARLDPKQVGQQGAAHVDRIGAIATYGEGEWIVSGGYGTVKIWRRQRNVVKRELSPTSPSQSAVKTSSDKLLATTQGTSIYLTSLVDAKQQSWDSGEPIVALTLSADSSQLFSATADGILRRWRTDTGESNGGWQLATTISSLAVLGNKQLVTSEDRVLRVWDLIPDTNEENSSDELPKLSPSRELIGHGRFINDLVASPQHADQILSGSDDGTMRCWNVSDGTQLQVSIHGQAVKEIAVAPDQSRAATVAEDGTVVLWDTEGNQEVSRIEGDYLLTRALARSQRIVAVAESNLEEANQAVQAVEKQLTLARQTLETTNKKLAESEKLTQKKEALLKELQSQQADQLVSPFQEAEKASLSAKLAAETARKNNRRDTDVVARLEIKIDRLGAERASREAIFAEKQQIERIMSDDLKQARTTIVSMTFSPDGRQLAIGNQHHKLFIYDARTGNPVDRFSNSTSVLVHASYVDERHLATIDNQRHMQIWDSQPHWILHKTLGSPTLDSPVTDRVLALDFSPDGKLLAVGSGEPSRSGQVSIWNVADGTKTTELSQPHEDTVFALAFSPDGQHLASSSADRQMKVFRVADNQLVRTFEGHTHHVLDVEWRANGKQLATSGADKQIKIWDFSSGKQLRTISGPDKEITAISFLGIGNQLASVSGDQQIRIHNVDDGKEIRSFSGESSYLFCCSATDLGDTIVTGGTDLTLRVWSTCDGKERFAFYEEKASQ